jgi:hypothetical protein
MTSSGLEPATFQLVALFQRPGTGEMQGRARSCTLHRGSQADLCTSQETHPSDHNVSI